MIQSTVSKPMSLVWLVDSFIKADMIQSTGSKSMSLVWLVDSFYQG